ncbi:hypothetical protein PPMP20_26565 [Paraburkholderia phymatum]|uniref:Restriction endonuclease n=1 Tax=Paraburkholderia phymatum (strain DSM 17167 / CIP 108236 / LMG 21445 / STM815) TaxID=391038 RepID=B2JL47_PARP8|nr:hypothetical protein [Paraburkholderia phymatum]ACC72576.1 hypothetical protein Bphy_3422 [Paraburkholderia phymatum STM815]
MTKNTVMSADDLFAAMKSDFEGKRRRKFAAGLLVALIDFMKALDTPSLKLKGLDEFYAKFPRQIKTAAGLGANTLIVSKPAGGTVSIRPFYGAIENFFRNKEKRYDFPSAAPHATQSWPDYVDWIGSLATFDLPTLDSLRDKVVKYVLEKLPSHEVDSSEIAKDPPVFEIFLRDFNFRAVGRGEPTGSGFQGAVFAYIRADSPHLQVEVDKTRTGSKRVHRIGDIDAWDGSRLVKTCEVKHFKVMTADAIDFTAFAGEAGKRRAGAYLVAEDFESEETRSAIEELGVKTMTLEDLKHHVSVWDPLKQQIALQAFEYFITHREQNSSLTSRFRQFCLDKGFRYVWSRPVVDDYGNQVSLLVLDESWKAD